MSTLIVGCGYLGRRVGLRLRQLGEEVWGTSRSAASAEEVRLIGIEPLVVDLLEPSTLNRLPEVDRVLHCVAKGSGPRSSESVRALTVDGLRNLFESLPETVRRFVHIGTTGVYGQTDGSWVDEESPVEPDSESGLAAREAETLVRDFGLRRGLTTVVLRCAGLYGPGRIVGRQALERGEPIPGDPDRYVNWVHIDDAAAAGVTALSAAEPGPLYLVSDDHPRSRRDYYTLAAEQLGTPPPRFEADAGSGAGTEGSPQPAVAPGSRIRRRSGADKRISNRRLKSELGVCLSYPDVLQGIAASLREEASQVFQPPPGPAR
jgi:nucleoside-diphosphate-sugar epimerase